MVYADNVSDHSLGLLTTCMHKCMTVHLISSSTSSLPIFFILLVLLFLISPSSLFKIRIFFFHLGLEMLNKIFLPVFDWFKLAIFIQIYRELAFTATCNNSSLSFVLSFFILLPLFYFPFLFFLFTFPSASPPPSACFSYSS